MKSRTIDDQANRDIVEIVTTDLRALLFWANVGVGYAQNGSYLGGKDGRGTDVRDVIASYAPYVKLHLRQTELGEFRLRKKQT